MYDVILSRGAKRDLGELRRGTPPADREAIVRAIQALADDPRPLHALRLVNSGYWRLRVRNFRVIFEIDDDANAVIVQTIARRSQGTYRDM